MVRTQPWESMNLREAVSDADCKSLVYKQTNLAKFRGRPFVHPGSACSVLAHGRSSSPGKRRINQRRMQEQHGAVRRESKSVGSLIRVIFGPSTTKVGHAPLLHLGSACFVLLHGCRLTLGKRRINPRRVQMQYCARGRGSNSVGLAGNAVAKSETRRGRIWAMHASCFRMGVDLTLVSAVYVSATCRCSIAQVGASQSRWGRRSSRSRWRATLKACTRLH